MDINVDLARKSLNFHGQLLLRDWEFVHGNEKIKKSKLEPSTLRFEECEKRKKSLSFNDRTKRLKLHRFIAERADIIFSPYWKAVKSEPTRTKVFEPGSYPEPYPFVSFLSLSKEKRADQFYVSLEKGDIIVGSIISKATAGLILKVNYSESDVVRCVNDLFVKAFCPTASIVPAVDNRNISRTYLQNDYVCCEIVEVSPDSEKIVCGMKGLYCRPERKEKLGLFHFSKFSPSYK